MEYRWKLKPSNHWIDGSSKQIEMLNEPETNDIVPKQQRRVKSAQSRLLPPRSIVARIIEGPRASLLLKPCLGKEAQMK